MEDSTRHREQDRQTETEGVDVDSDSIKSAADAVAEIMIDADLQIEPEEALTVAKELLEEFSSPLMIQRAAGATSQVSITASPAGGEEGGQSVKARNILVNLKTAAFALPSTLPALLAVYERNGSADHVRLAMAAVIALYGWLTVLSKARKVPLTKRTAGILRVMWRDGEESGDVISNAGLLEKVNAEFEAYDWQPIDAEELITTLEALEKIGCIERDAPYESILAAQQRWRLKEKVKVTF